MNTKFSVIISGAILLSSLNIASAGPVLLSSKQMDSVSAGAIWTTAAGSAYGRITTTNTQTGASSNSSYNTTYQAGYGGSVSTATGESNPTAYATTSAHATGNILASNQFNGHFSSSYGTVAYSLSYVSSINFTNW